jgi:hypothetical protein
MPLDQVSDEIVSACPGSAPSRSGISSRLAFYHFFVFSCASREVRFTCHALVKLLLPSGTRQTGTVEVFTRSLDDEIEKKAAITVPFFTSLHGMMV